MNEVIFTQDVTLLDYIIRAIIVVGWISIMIIDAIQRHKDKREEKRLYDEWLNRKNK